MQAAYCGAKHAIVGFTDALRCELLHDQSRVQVVVVHLPAMNTPQFGKCVRSWPTSPQPVPPIFQPEVAARVIVRAAEHPRREYWVGMSTVAAIIGQRLAPGLLDRYLARTGYRSQQTAEPAAADRRDNLEEPMPGDLGARGDFSAHAHEHSLQAWASTHRRTLLGAGVAAIAAAALARDAAR